MTYNQKLLSENIYRVKKERKGNTQELGIAFTGNKHCPGSKPHESVEPSPPSLPKSSQGKAATTSNTLACTVTHSLLIPVGSN